MRLMLDWSVGLSLTQYGLDTVQRPHRPKVVGAKQALELLAPACQKYDRLEGHPTRIRAQFLAQRLHQSIDDPIRVDATTCPDLIDHRIAVNQPPREERDVLDFLLEPDDGNVDVSESHADQ